MGICRLLDEIAFAGEGRPAPPRPGRLHCFSGASTPPRSALAARDLRFSTKPQQECRP